MFDILNQLSNSLQPKIGDRHPAEALAPVIRFRFGFGEAQILGVLFIPHVHNLFGGPGGAVYSPKIDQPRTLREQSKEGVRMYRIV